MVEGKSDGVGRLFEVLIWCCVAGMNHGMEPGLKGTYLRWLFGCGKWKSSGTRDIHIAHDGSLGMVAAGLKVQTLFYCNVIVHQQP